MAGRRPSDVPAARRQALSEGRIESKDLAETLAVDFALLMRSAFPDLPRRATALVEGMARAGITRRMALAASVLLDELGPDAIEAAARHGSDTVRGWAAYGIGQAEGPSLAERFARIRPLAADPHFGVREWAWLGLRHHVVAAPLESIALLTPWTAEREASLRRFAVEATRPRGVWSSHVALLKRQPEAGRALLDPLADDPARYVQDSVANWLNDAAKDNPGWVRRVLAEWATDTAGEARTRIVKRAGRSLDAVA